MSWLRFDRDGLYFQHPNFGVFYLRGRLIEQRPYLMGCSWAFHVTFNAGPDQILNAP